jgi:arsenate reductase
MAEAWLRHLGDREFECESAGTEETRVHPLAIAAMAEAGVDMSNQRSKLLDGFLTERFDVVITVCDRANESCPVFFNAAERLHWSFEDPSAADGTDDEKLAQFRRIRDEIHSRISQFISGGN